MKYGRNTVATKRAKYDKKNGRLRPDFYDLVPNGSDEDVFTVEELAENIYRVKSNILNPFFFYFYYLFVGGKITKWNF
jgi:hypothetical protein